MTIRGKLLGAFMLATVGAAILGGMAIFVTWTLGTLTVRMFDHPLMTVNFARSAQTGFAMMQIDDHGTASLDPAVRDAAMRDLDKRAKVFLEDLGVAEQRGRSEQIARMAAEIRGYISAWPKAAADARSASGPNATALAAIRDQLGEKISNELEILVQIAADEGFGFREQAEDIIEVTRLWTAVLMAVLAVVMIIVT